MEFANTLIKIGTILDLKQKQVSLDVAVESSSFQGTIILAFTAVTIIFVLFLWYHANEYY
jgi:hypothetical protein